MYRNPTKLCGVGWCDKKRCSACMHKAMARAGLHGEPMGIPSVCWIIVSPTVKKMFSMSWCIIATIVSIEITFHSFCMVGVWSCGVAYRAPDLPFCLRLMATPCWDSGNFLTKSITQSIASKRAGWGILVYMFLMSPR